LASLNACVNRLLLDYNLPPEQQVPRFCEAETDAVLGNKRKKYLNFQFIQKESNSKYYEYQKGEIAVERFTDSNKTRVKSIDSSCFVISPSQVVTFTNPANDNVKIEAVVVALLSEDRATALLAPRTAVSQYPAGIPKNVMFKKDFSVLCPLLENGSYVFEPNYSRKHYKKSLMIYMNLDPKNKVAKDIEEDLEKDHDEAELGDSRRSSLRSNHSNVSIPIKNKIDNPSKVKTPTKTPSGKKKPPKKDIVQLFQSFSVLPPFPPPYSSLIK
jgi:hypothetical protein